ncbi:MAG: sugar ABC transporter permease [Clostridiales bacterium]|nr:sugar ABC transporter permease [Clostridiales bacterium]
MGKTENTAKGTQCKPAKIVTIAMAIALVVFLAVSIVFGCLLPTSERLVTAEGQGNYTSMIMREDGTWYYTTSNGLVCQMSAEDELIETFDLNKAAKEDTRYGWESCGSAATIHAEVGSPYIYVVSRQEDTYRLFQLVENDEKKLEIASATPLSGKVGGIQEENGEVFLLMAQGPIYRIERFDAENLEAGAIASGYLYTVAPAMPNWKLFLVKEPKILSFDIIDNYIYIMHGSGIIRMSKDFEMNKWESLLPGEIDVVYERLANATVGETTRFEADYQAEWERNYTNELEALKKQAGEDISAEKLAELEAKAKENTNAKEISMKNTVEQKIRQEAADEVLLGSTYDRVAEYEESSGTVTLKVKTAELYASYANILGKQFRGAAYNEEKGCYYFVTNEYGVYTCTLEEINEMIATRGNDEEAELELHPLSGIELEERPSSDGRALFYDEVSQKGYILHDSSDYVTSIDFKTEEFLFYSKMDFDIRDMKQSLSGNRIYYFYLNSNEAESGEMILRAVDITNQAQEWIYRPIMTVAIVLCVLAVIVGAISLGCMRSERWLAYVIDVGRGFKKHWGIYAVLSFSLVLLGMFCYYPAVGSISLSFYDYTDDKPTRIWNNFWNYKEIFTNRFAWEEFSNMFIFLGMDLVTALAPPLIFAFCLTIMRNRQYSGLMRTLLFIPGIIPGLATTLIWKTGIFGMDGVLNTLFNSEVQFLQKDGLALWSLILMGFPYVGSYLIFYGAMMNVPDSYYEAAELDGITVMKRFIFIDIPLIFPQIKYVIIMTFISSVQNFGRIYMVTKGAAGTRTPIFAMYEYIKKDNNYGMASAYATILFVFLFGATVFNMRKKKKELEV